MADTPPTPLRSMPPAAREPSPLGKDIPQNEALRRARTIRSGAMIMAALWEE